jgi:Fe-S-cluster containining protein
MIKPELMMQIPQILNSEQCLKCRGCCLFHQPEGDWSPRLTPEDVSGLMAAEPDGAWRNGSGRIVLKPCQGANACSFLDEKNHHCRAYGAHPFECRLYPFLISSEKSGFKVYAHLSCPGIDQLRAAGMWEGAVAKIRAFFAQTDVRSFIHRNAVSFPDYSLSKDETEEVLAFDPGASLWAEKPRIEAALAMSSRPLSSLAFVNMFAWQEFFTFHVEQIEGALCVFASQPVGTFLYWPPLARNIPAGAVDACFDRMRQLNRGGSLTRIENVEENELESFDEKKYTAQLRGHEYIYRRADVAALRGNGHKTRRGEVNLFERTQAGAYVWRAYTGDDFNPCAILFDRWLDGRFQKHDNDIYQQMLAENRMVHRLVLAHAGRLGLVGRVVEVQGRVVAYTFGYRLNADTFCVLFEVADLSVKGLAAFVFNRFCRDEALEGFLWVNAMDDFAAEDLARTKMSWRPEKLQAVYAVILRD